MTAEQASQFTIPWMFGGWDPSLRVVYPKLFDAVVPIVDPALPDGTLGSYTKPVLVYMEVNNEVPATNRVQYRINDGEWTFYSKEFAISDAGTHNIVYRYVDALGTPSTSGMTTIHIDPAESQEPQRFQVLKAAVCM